ncbi:Guanine deaminase [Novipirellula aureliae]|uniref:Guanine deaminase n=1 Tax=Novipirellula aureliae TaxID=2527966 RepID=A0A5C6DIW2_9BACT|nr:amidohydrolase family protein [Novipirellula aureliae]TWU35827.1 Guanine deaminase [Novipirellula aureliae]
MTILAGQLLLAESPNQLELRPGFVRIDDDHIREVVEGELPRSADYLNPNALICPGFIDTHLHLPQFNMIGAHSMPLLQWLESVVFSEEEKWADASYAHKMSTQVYRQLLSVGTTSFCAYASVHHDATLCAMELAHQTGFRALIGQVLMNRFAPKSLCPSTNQLIDEASKTIERFPIDKQIAAAVTPRFAISCTYDLLEAAGRLATQASAFVQTHLSETVAECRQVSELFDGARYVDVYQKSGLLGTRSILGHGIHLSVSDRKVLADHECKIAHCPTANTFLGSGAMDREALETDSVTVVLGSDIGAGYERSMVRVARAMIETASLRQNKIPSASSAWYDITAGAADALGWSDVGRLQSGCRADVLVIEPDIKWIDSPVDPLSMLMFAWDDRWIKRTYLRGQWRHTEDSR